MGPYTKSLVFLIYLCDIVYGQNGGFGDLLPQTCQQMLDLLPLNNSLSSSQSQPVPLEDEFSSLTRFCSFSNIILQCVSENIYEMKMNPDPLVWASGYLYSIVSAHSQTQLVCLWRRYPKSDAEKCLENTRNSRSRCRERVRSNLQYVHDNVSPDMSDSEIFDIVCPIYYELGQCVELGINKDCDPETVLHIKLFYMILGRMNCSNQSDISIKGFPSNSTSLQENAITNTLSTCGFDVSLYGMPEQKFSFRNYMASLNKICPKLDEIVLCVKEQLKNPRNSIQRFLKRSIDVEGMAVYSKVLCKAQASLPRHIGCLDKLDDYVDFCATLVKRNNVLDRLFDQTKSDEPMTCSILEDFSQCFTIQISRCNFHLAQMVRRANTEGLHGECKLGKHTPSHIGGSVLVHCGVAIVTEVEGRVATIGNTSTVAETVDHLITFMCGEMSNLLTCANRYLEESKSVFDLFLKQILDLSNMSKTREIVQHVCDNINLVKKEMPCLLQNNQFPHCAALALPLIRTDILDIKTLKGRELQKKICNDVVALSNCTLSAIYQCNKDLGKLAKDTVENLLHAKQCDKENTASSSGLPKFSGVLLMVILICLLRVF